MEILKDLYYTNRSILKTTTNSIIKNWPIIFTGIFYTIATIFLYTILPYFWILAGLVLIIATSGLTSNYLHLIDGIIKRDKITKQDFKEGFTVYLRKVWGILFLFYVGRMAFNLLVMPILSGFIHPMALENMLIFLTMVFLNPIPEVLYQKHYSSWESITYSLEFVKENWIEWFIPNIIFGVLMYLLTGNIIKDVLNYYLPLNTLLSSKGFVFYLLGQILFSFMMVYRGYLFETLSTSNRRKRLFMRKY